MDKIMHSSRKLPFYCLFIFLFILSPGNDIFGQKPLKNKIFKDKILKSVTEKDQERERQKEKEEENKKDSKPVILKKQVAKPQLPSKPQAQSTTQTKGETTQVQFKAINMRMDKNLGNGAKRLLGDVVFTHEGVVMYCDSAYFYSEENSLDAFSNVYITQGDTLHLYGDFLHYDGNTKQAKIKHNVKLINGDITLTTQELDYNMEDGVGYYTHYAKIVNEENTLESIYGYYYTKTDWMHFRDSIIIVNPDYTVYSDTLHYQTEHKVAHFYGPTEIVGDSNYIYCERGWYDTKRDISELNRNALVENKQQTLMADSIYYNRNSGFGYARKNVVLIDNDQEAILTGERGKYYEFTEYALMTDSAVFIQITDEDSVYIHADTLLSFPDTNDNKVIQAYYGVRMFKTNLQARCDSMVYTFVDSTAHLYYEPIIWNDNNQMTAEQIRMENKNKQIDKMYLDKDALIIQQVDSVKFNQIKGKNMICHFKDNDLNKIDVKGNGQTVYYPEDKGEIIGVNKMECSNMVIRVVDGALNNISFLVKPSATLYPLDKAPINELRLKGFEWLDEIRPKTMTDIFK